MSDSLKVVDAAHRLTVEAAKACLAATGRGTLDFRRARREFDPTWDALNAQISAFAIVMREQGASIEEAIAAVKNAIFEAGPELPPHNALRAAAVGWCVAAFHGKDRKSSL